MSFNPFQDQQFGGASDLKFFTDLAPRRVMLQQFSNGVLDQGSEGACTGYATKAALDVFSKVRGVPVDLSWAYIYWVARRLDQSPMFFGADTGVELFSVFKALYRDGACLQSFMPNDAADFTPPQAAFDDAAARKVALFERMDLFDCKNAIVTALAHDMPVVFSLGITHAFQGIQSTDPVEQMAAFNYPAGRIGGGFPDFAGLHALPIVGYDLDLDCVFVQNSEGVHWCNGGVGAISFPTLAAQILQAYAVREFAGLTSYIDPKWIVSANANHNSAVMLNLRRYMFNVLTNTQLTQLYKSQVTRDAMPLFGVTAQDLADAAAPWGVTLQIVNDFLALSAP